MPSSASGGGSPRQRRASIHGKSAANRLVVADLARRAGAAVAEVDRLVALGIVSDRAQVGGTYTDADVRKVRFAQSLEKSGVALEDVATAVRNGDVSLAFLDSPAWRRFGAVGQATFRQASGESGIPLELMLTIREAIGFARPEPDDLLREDELPLVEWMAAALEGDASPAATERILRVWGEHARQMAQAGTDWFHLQFEVPRLQAGMSEGAAMEAASAAAAAVGARVDSVVGALYHGQSEHTWIANKLDAVETALERLGLRAADEELPAVCFLDLSGYTQLTEELGDEAGAGMAASLGELVRRSVSRQGGRPFKWLGDGVMVLFSRAGEAVASVLDLVDAVSAAALPPAHAGLSAGPVFFQDGDYFGRTVNLASRVAARAQAGEVLVTDVLMRATNDPRVAFVEVGLVGLRGVSQPIRLHRAVRARSGS